MHRGLTYPYALTAPKPKEHLEFFREPAKPREKATTVEKKKVVCVETGEIYESIKAAARDKGLNNGAISAAVNSGLRKRCGGYHWEEA